MPLERVFALGSQELLLTSRGPAKKMVALIGALDASEDLVKSKGMTQLPVNAAILFSIHRTPARPTPWCKYAVMISHHRAAH